MLQAATLALFAQAQLHAADAAPPSLTPEQIQTAISAFDALAPELLTRSGVPGMAVVITSADQVYYARGLGVRDSRTLEPIDTETVFQLASLSKPLSSSIVAGVVSDGDIDWDLPVSPLVPELAMPSPIVTSVVTIADLLSHRSGLPDHGGDLLEDLGYDRTTILERLRYLPLQPFRISNNYTNMGFTAGGLVASRTRGLTWPELAQQRLFDRIGMQRSSYRFEDYIQDPNHATLHAYVDGQYLPLYERNADVQAPAGSASASIDDMGRWLRLMVGAGQYDDRTVIEPTALLQTQIPQSISGLPDNAGGRAGFYGLGWNVGYDVRGRTRLSHSGAFMLGAATTVTVYPGEGIGIVVLTNGAPYGLAEATAASFFQLLFDGEADPTLLERFFERFSEEWASERDFMRNYDNPPVDPIPPLQNAAYTGIYRSPYYGLLVVGVDAGGLTLWLGPQAMQFPLSHWDGNLFVFETTGENALGLSGAEFHVQRGQAAASVTLERYDEYGLGTFERIFSLPPF